MPQSAVIMLVPVDGGESADRDLRLASTLATGVGARVTALHVSEALPAPPLDGLLDLIDIEGWRILNRVCVLDEAPGVIINRNHVRVRRTALAILRHASLILPTTIVIRALFGRRGGGHWAERRPRRRSRFEPRAP